MIPVRDLWQDTNAIRHLRMSELQWSSKYSTLIYSSLHNPDLSRAYTGCSCLSLERSRPRYSINQSWGTASPYRGTKNNHFPISKHCALTCDWWFWAAPHRLRFTLLLARAAANILFHQASEILTRLCKTLLQKSRVNLQSNLLLIRSSWAISIEAACAFPTTEVLVRSSTS